MTDIIIQADPKKEQAYFNVPSLYGLAPGIKGAVSELVACAYLLRVGCMVFRNVAPNGIADIAAFKDGKMHLIDVKTAQPSMKGFIERPTDKNKEQKRYNVEFLYVLDDGKCYWES